VKLERSHLATVDVAKPVMEKIPAYKLRPEQHLQFLTTEKGYIGSLLGAGQKNIHLPAAHEAPYFSYSFRPFQIFNTAYTTA